MVYLIIIVVFFFFSFFSSHLSSSLRVFFPIYPPRYAFSFPFIFLATRFLPFYLLQISCQTPLFFVFFLFFLRLLSPPLSSASPLLWGPSSLFCARPLRWRVFPLFPCLSLSPFPVRHFPFFVSANIGGWEMPLRISLPCGGLSSLFCARPLRWRVSVSVSVSFSSYSLSPSLSPSLVGRVGVGLFIGEGLGGVIFFKFICICQIFFVPLHRQKHQHLQYYIHSI